MIKTIVFAAMLIGPNVLFAAEPKEAPKNSDPGVLVHYVGRQGIPVDGPRDPILIQVHSSGNFSTGRFVLSADEVKKLLTAGAKIRESVVVSLEVSEPTETSFKTVAESIKKLRELAPKDVKMTIYLAD